MSNKLIDKEPYWEILFGDNAINRDFSEEEALQKLKEFSDKALKYDERKRPMNTYIVTAITHHAVETVVEASNEVEALAKFNSGHGNERSPEFLDEAVQSVEIEEDDAW